MLLRKSQLKLSESLIMAKSKTTDKVDTVSQTDKNKTALTKKPSEEKAELAKRKRLDLTERVLNHISEGLSQTDALAFVGVPYSTWNLWMRTYPEMLVEIRQAEISLKVRHLQNIQKHSENDVRASQWLLARKFPLEFGEKQTIDMNTKGDDSKVIINVIQQVQKEKHGQTVQIKHELPNESDDGTDEED